MMHSLIRPTGPETKPQHKTTSVEACGSRGRQTGAVVPHSAYLACGSQTPVFVEAGTCAGAGGTGTLNRQQTHGTVHRVAHHCNNVQNTSVTHGINSAHHCNNVQNTSVTHGINSAHYCNNVQNTSVTHGITAVPLQQQNTSEHTE